VRQRRTGPDGTAHETTNWNFSLEILEAVMRNGEFPHPDLSGRRRGLTVPVVTGFACETKVLLSPGLSFELPGTGLVFPRDDYTVADGEDPCFLLEEPPEVFLVSELPVTGLELRAPAADRRVKMSGLVLNLGEGTLNESWKDRQLGQSVRFEDLLDPNDEETLQEFSDVVDFVLARIENMPKLGYLTNGDAGFRAAVNFYTPLVAGTDPGSTAPSFLRVTIDGKEPVRALLQAAPVVFTDGELNHGSPTPAIRQTAWHVRLSETEDLLLPAVLVDIGASNSRLKTVGTHFLFYISVDVQTSTDTAEKVTAAVNTIFGLEHFILLSNSHEKLFAKVALRYGNLVWNVFVPPKKKLRLPWFKEGTIHPAGWDEVDLGAYEDSKRQADICARNGGYARRCSRVSRPK